MIVQITPLIFLQLCYNCRLFKPNIRGAVTKPTVGGEPEKKNEQLTPPKSPEEKPLQPEKAKPVKAKPLQAAVEKALQATEENPLQPQKAKPVKAKPQQAAVEKPPKKAPPKYVTL